MATRHDRARPHRSNVRERAIVTKALRDPSPTRQSKVGAIAPRETAAVVELLAELFSSRIRAVLLTFLIPRLDKRFSLTELARELDTPISSLQHECYKLERLGILIGRREAGSRRYRVAVGTPVTDALIHLVVTTIGVEHALREAFAATTGLEGALIAASPDPGSGGALNLVLIGDLALEQVQATLVLVARLSGHQPEAIELAFFQPADWRSHHDQGHPVVRRLLDLPILVAFGLALGRLDRDGQGRS